MTILTLILLYFIIGAWISVLRDANTFSDHMNSANWREKYKTDTNAFIGAMFLWPVLLFLAIRTFGRKLLCSIKE